MIIIGWIHSWINIFISAPKLNPVLSQLHQDVGSKFKFHCTIQSGKRPIQFDWFVNGNTLYFDHSDQIQLDKIDDDESTLTIKRLELNNSGNYSCQARNEFGIDVQSTMLIVQGWWWLCLFHLKFYSKCGAMFAFVETKMAKMAKWVIEYGKHSFVFFLILIRLLMAKFEWMKTMSCLNICLQMIFVLGFYNYLCNAKNGMFTKLFTVNIIHWISFFIFSATAVPKLDLFPSGLLEEGSRLKLFCTLIDGTKPVSFEWLKNGFQLTDLVKKNYRIEYFDSESYLIIDNVTRSDSGNFTCSVRNNFGLDSRSILANIKGLNLWIFFYIF